MPSHKARFLALLLLVALGLTVRAEHPLATLQPVLPTHGPLTQVAEWQGRAVALSADPNGNILRRQAQGNWEEIATGLPYIAELVQNGTLSLALTRDGTLHRSQAWPQWEEVPPFEEKITGLRALNGEFWVWTGPVSIVNNVRPGLYRSPDGITWTEVTTGLGFPQPPIRRINDLQWANSRYVLTGNAYQRFQGVSRHHGGLWTSSDGTYWTRHADVDNEFTSATYGNGRWVAVTTNENYAISTDGVTWTPQQHNFVSHHISNSLNTYPVYSPLNNIVWNGLNFTAIADDRGSPLLVVSDNGIDWHPIYQMPERSRG